MTLEALGDVCQVCDIRGAWRLAARGPARRSGTHIHLAAQEQRQAIMQGQQTCLLVICVFCKA